MRERCGNKERTKVEPFYGEQGLLRRVLCPCLRRSICDCVAITHVRGDICGV